MPVTDLFHKVDDPSPGWIGGFGTISEFGGPDDQEDSGNTASGFSTKLHPDWPYCAIPIPVKKKYGLKWGTAIILQRGSVTVCGTLVDLGPSAKLMRICDVSHSLMTQLGGSGLLDGVRVLFRP